MARERAWGWFGPVSGILFAVLVVVAFTVMGGGPDADIDDTGAKIARELEDSRDGAAASFPVFGLALFFFLFFLAFLRDRFRQAGEAGDWLVSVLWGSGLVFMTMFLIQGFVQAAQFAVDDYGADTQVAKAVFAIGWESILVMGPPMAAFGLSAALLTLRFKLLPPWLGWFAVLVFLGGFVPWIGGPVLILWVVFASIALLVETRRTPAPVQ